MITNKGNQIITKYMLGQAPEYAAYLSIGVGAAPLGLTENDATSTTKKSMDFEAFRVPVTSRGLVNDNVTVSLSAWSVTTNVVTATTSTSHGARIGDEVTLAFTSATHVAKQGTFTVTAVSSTTITYAQTISSAAWTPGSGDTATLSYSRERIVFKAQLPSDQRYQMSEIGIWPAPSNNLALNYDSKLVAGFLPTEGWTFHKVVGGVHSDNEIPFVTTSISDSLGSTASATFVSSSGSAQALFLNSDNDVFAYPSRIARKEPPRFLNKCLATLANLTTFTDDTMDQPANAQYISTSNIKLDLSKNSPNDYVKLAISVLSADVAAITGPFKVRLRMEFIDDATKNAAMTSLLTDAGGSYATGRYLIISKQISEFSAETGFNWAKITGVKVYVQQLESGGAYTNGCIVVFDGLRIDNENTENPLYGMVAYSRLKNGYSDGQPILKVENSQGYIEYRLGVNVV